MILKKHGSHWVTFLMKILQWLSMAVRIKPNCCYHMQVLMWAGGIYIIVLIALLSYLAGSAPPILALSLFLKNAETFASWRLWLLFTPLPGSSSLSSFNSQLQCLYFDGPSPYPKLFITVIIFEDIIALSECYLRLSNFFHINKKPSSSWWW